MEGKIPHKYQEKLEVTYEQYLRDSYAVAVDLAREFEKVLGSKETLEIIRKANENRAVQQAEKQATANPIRNLEDFKAFMRQARTAPFLSRAQTSTIKEEKPRQFTVQVTECLWAKTLRELGSADLGYAMICHSDFATAQAFNPKIKLRRTGTLMQGANCCDNTYYWEE